MKSNSTHSAPGWYAVLPKILRRATVPPSPFPMALHPTRRNWDSVYMKFLRVLANMRPLTAPIILTFIPIATSLLLLLLSSTTSVKADELENCCDKVYLFSSDDNAIGQKLVLFFPVLRFSDCESWALECHQKYSRLMF